MHETAEHDTAVRAHTAPVTPLEHITAEATGRVLQVQHALLAAVGAHLSGEGFTQVLMPVVGPVTDPGTRGSKQVDVDYYGHRYKLMTSAILYKQAVLKACGKIFTIAPNVRLEPMATVATHRHLAEFRQIDVEIAGASRADAMMIAEKLLTMAVRTLARTVPDELRALGRDPEELVASVTGPFERVPHARAVEDLRRLAYDQSDAAEIAWEAEELLSGKAEHPFFVIDYPKGSRGFYDRESAATPGVLESFDLIAPEGYGELASGGARECDYAAIVTRMRETGENPAKYQWYLEMARDGIPPSAGFGMGVERLTRYLCGRSAVWEATAFPKVPGAVMP